MKFEIQDIDVTTLLKPDEDSIKATESISSLFQRLLAKLYEAKIKGDENLRIFVTGMIKSMADAFSDDITLRW